MTVRVISMRDKLRHAEFMVNTTSRAEAGWQRTLSPFLLGPCKLYKGHISKNMENSWQHAKLYRAHADKTGDPTSSYWDWAKKGWADTWAHRYPMGRGAKPLCSLWDGERLDYIEARKKIYVPLYAEAVLKTEGWKHLEEFHQAGQDLALKDFDGYDHQVEGVSLTEVLNNPRKRMGHAFVLMMLLLEDPALAECEMRFHD